MSNRFLSLVTTTAVCLVLGSVAAGAQDAGKTGLAIGYPGGIGVLWHASDKVAVRPDITVSRSTSEGTTSDDSWGVGTDLTVLFYLKKSGNLRTYVAPRFSYTRTSSTLQITIASAQSTTTTSNKSTTNSSGGAGLFGVQYSASPRFSVFGEAGIAFSHRSNEAGLTGTTSTGNSWGTTAGVGVIFYP
jgi:hypothetical protein